MSDRKTLRLTLCGLLILVASLCVCSLIFAPDNIDYSSEKISSGTFGSFEFPAKLRVATYNLHNFRDENRISETGKFLYRYPKSEKSKEAIYRTVLEVRPDILAVQEIGGDVWVREFSEGLAKRGLDFPYHVYLDGWDERNRLAIFSRFPFSKKIELAVPEKLTRGLLGVVVPVADGKLLVVYNVHLKSKVSSDPDDPESNERRSREARYVRRLIEYNVCEEKTAEKIPASVRARMPSRMEFAPPELFLLLGDFNDVPASKPLASLEVESFARSLPARNDTGGILTFFNPQRGYFHTFDRIFASPEIFRKYYVPSSAKIAEFPWSQTASDHRLVYADFDFSSAERRSPEQLSDKK